MSSGKHRVPSRRNACTSLSSLVKVGLTVQFTRSTTRALLQEEPIVKFPVALGIVAGVIGGVLVWLYAGPLSALGLFAPATFMGAACYFAAGGDPAALRKSIPANLWGIVVATLTLLVASLVSGPALTGVVVGAGTLVMIAGGVVPFLEFVPGIVVAFAMTVGWGLLTSEAPLGLPLPLAALLVMVISFLIGNVFGWVGGLLAGRMVAGRATARV